MFFVCSNSFSSEGLYLSVGGGFERLQDTNLNIVGFPGKFEYSDGYEINSRIGYMFNYFRIEAELSQSKNNVEKLSLLDTTVDASGIIKTRAIMINAYFCYENSTHWLPYIGVGYGKSQVIMDEVSNENLSTSFVNEKTNTPAFQMKLGIIYKINLQYQLSLGYKLFRTSHVSFMDLSSDAKINMNGLRQEILEAGVQYNF